MCVECGCRFQQAYERTRDVQEAENLLTPEIRAEIIETIAILLARLVEAGPAMDPQARAALRAQLQSALTRLGIDIDQPQWGILYGDLIWQLLKDKQFPKKPKGYPRFDVFSAKVQDALSTNPEFLGNLRGRDGMELAEYLYGLGFILASRLSYEFIFPRTDPIVVNEETGEILGRHRYVTLAILEALGLDTRHWHWIRIEQPRG